MAATTNSAPAVATHIEESCVVAAPVDAVFNAVSNLRFDWWPNVASSSVGTASQQGQGQGGGDSGGGDVVLGSNSQLHFKDGVTWTLQVRGALVGPGRTRHHRHTHLLTHPHPHPPSLKTQVMEASLIRHSIAFEVIGHDPASSYTSALHTITCRRISTSNQCFVQWETDFSNDATADIVLDSSYKKKEAFSALAVRAHTMHDHALVSGGRVGGSPALFQTHTHPYLTTQAHLANAKGGASA